MSERKVVIENTYMPDEMQQFAVDCATQALEKYNNGEDFADIADIADFIRKEFDKKYNPGWAWTAGPKMLPMFMDAFTFREWNHIYLSVGQFYILLFKPFGRSLSNPRTTI